jgi:hypothetical protein
MLVIDFNTFNYVKLCLKMISNELRFHVTMRMMWREWNVENCISVWKHEYVWCKSLKHKHVHGTKRWTKDPWDVYPWAPCNKTIGLRTSWHYEMKDLWAVYPWAPWNERPLGYVPLGTKIRWKQIMSMHIMMMMICDMFYDDFMTRCISMPVSLKGTKHRYTVTGRLHRCFIWNFMLGVPIYLWVWMEQKICI